MNGRDQIARRVNFHLSGRQDAAQPRAVAREGSTTSTRRGKSGDSGTGPEPHVISLVDTGTNESKLRSLPQEALTIGRPDLRRARHIVGRVSAAHAMFGSGTTRTAPDRLTRESVTAR